MLFSVSDPNRHATSGIHCLISLIMLIDAALSWCPYDFWTSLLHHVGRLHASSSMERSTIFRISSWGVLRRYYWWSGPKACFLGFWFPPTAGWFFFACLAWRSPWWPGYWRIFPPELSDLCWRQWGYSLPPCPPLLLVINLRNLPWFQPDFLICSHPGMMSVAALRGRIEPQWSGPGRSSRIFYPASSTPNSLQGIGL